MPNYKLAVSKEGSKYSIIFKADNEIAARNRVHKEGYSILGIEETEKYENYGNTFIFEGYKNGEFKHGKIVGSDIFKSYLRLRRNLEYDISYIYSENDKNITEEKKINIVKELEEEYNLFYKNTKKDKLEDLREKIKKDKENKNKSDNFFLKKELEYNNKIINTVLEKLYLIINGKYLENINLETKNKLKEIYNNIIKLKNTTNISKLKEIAELALIKIGEIELKELEKSNNEENRKILKETNKLLKKVGSKNQFIEKNRDINYQLNNFFILFKSKLLKIKKNTILQNNDNESHYFVKNRLYLFKYQEKLKKNTIFILKNFYKFFLDKELMEETFLVRKVIKQNISLFKARETGVIFSYTFLKKGFKILIYVIMNFFNNLKNYIFYVILFYLLIFLFFINFSSFFNLNSYNYDGMFYFIIILFLYVILSISKNIIILMINFVFLFFIIIFGVINF